MRAIVERSESNIGLCDSLIAAGFADSTLDFFVDGNTTETVKEKKEKLEKVLPAQKGRLRSLEDARDTKLKALDSVSEPIVSDKLMMLNLIKVI